MLDATLGDSSEMYASLVMIDRDGARDRDDAVTAVTRTDGTGWDIEVHIAAVADSVAPGSVPDRQAFLRGHTRYLRNRTIPMLGLNAELGATLSPDTTRTSLQVTAHCDHAGHWHNVQISRGTIPAGRCVTLDHAQIPALFDDAADPLHPTITALDQVSKLLLAARQQSGALAIYDLTRGWATNEDGAPVTVAAAERTTGYVIVQEFMIAANRVLAQWCIERALPILFRTHRPNPVEGPTALIVAELAAAADNAALFVQLQHRLAGTVLPAQYEAIVGGHHGLRLAAYTHATSPLRRLADLINQRIVLAHLDTKPSPYTPAQLATIGDDLNRRTRERKESTAAHFAAASARTTAANTTAHLNTLDPAAFSKVLKMMREHDLRDDLAREITARSSDDRLTVTDTALLFTATGAGWSTLAADIIDFSEKTRPHWAPSLIAMLRQTNPHSPDLVVDTDARGAAHNPQFAARAHWGDLHGSWAIATTKKRAAQDATWSLLKAALTATCAPDREPPWNDETRQRAMVVEPETTLDAAEPRNPDNDLEAVTTALVPAKRNKALSNPVAWLIALATNTGVTAPAYTVDTTGPAHALDFTTTLTFAGLSTYATSTNKSTAKTSAAAALVDTLFDHAGSDKLPDEL